MGVHRRVHVGAVWETHHFSGAEEFGVDSDKNGPCLLVTANLLLIFTLPPETDRERERERERRGENEFFPIVDIQFNIIRFSKRQ